ncbi:DDE-type integrase/transposase/recombinase [Micromonospora purpureochromogenes]|uniref:DDE-type integrase/transposase/recombinase n=1 Tax=Micromonospora purpureochromogenes TaxID=47872 RepID=UPI0012FDFD32|nr:DDE-type integrase/transposase/recombinase [Micromonospora purpureochromogenes]
MRRHDRDRHREGKLYLATVIDLYSRRILGYAMGAHHDAALVVAALNMAAVTRGGDVAGVIFHSDRGAEYTSAEFAKACARWQVRQSMGRVGSCFDNAVAEPLTHRLRTINVSSTGGSSRITESSTISGD